MKRFRFRLQKLLELERRATDQARRDAAAALGAVREAEATLAAGIAKREGAHAELARVLAADRLDFECIRTHQGWIDALGAELRTLAARLATSEEICEKARAALALRQREKLVLERARDAACADWCAETEKDELAQLEETAASRWLRSGDES